MVVACLAHLFLHTFCLAEGIVWLPLSYQSWIYYELYIKCIIPTFYENLPTNQTCKEELTIPSQIYDTLIKQTYSTIMQNNTNQMKWLLCTVQSKNAWCKVMLIKWRNNFAQCKVKMQWSKVRLNKWSSYFAPCKIKCAKYKVMLDKWSSYFAQCKVKCAKCKVMLVK